MKLAFRATATALVLATCAGSLGVALAAGPSHHSARRGFAPMSDAAAAAHVIRTRESRPANAVANHTVPTAAALRAFRAARYPFGMTTVQWNPYARYVTGHYAGTTDEIIQWAAWKWGIPTDLLRAMLMQESLERQSQLGDLTTVSASWYAAYPLQARLPPLGLSTRAYESMGISQIKWRPDGSIGAGTEPLRWMSTAFAVDYCAATVRFYYDDPRGRLKALRDPGYRPHQGWNSAGAWYDPYPWGNPGQKSYIANVKRQLSARSWFTATLSPFPSHVWVPERGIVRAWRKG